MKDLLSLVMPKKITRMDLIGAFMSWNDGIPIFAIAAGKPVKNRRGNMYFSPFG